MNAKAIATLYLKQSDRWVNGGEWVEGEVSALTVWESLITDDPEQAWPVFLEIVAQRQDDETLYQVGHRLYLLLFRHWEQFHERAEELVRSIPRFSRIVGPDLFDREYFVEKPLDIAALIQAHETMDNDHGLARAVGSVIERDPDRGLQLAVEIIHRGPFHGLTSFDTFSPLQDLLIRHGAQIIDQVETAARGSYRIRRALWRMVPGQRGRPDQHRIGADVWKRVLAATAGTTEWTDDAEPEPAAKSLGEVDEAMLAAWFEYHKNFWAFERISDLVSDDPETAWPILLQMINRTDDPMRLGSLAAGPLEDLLYDHGPLLFDRIAEEARSNRNLREALGGVWISRSEIYPRYQELMSELREDGVTG